MTFYLKSRYSWAQRQANAPGPRYVFTLRDGNGTEQMFVLTEETSGYVTFVVDIWGTLVYYYVPKGIEDTLFGNGVILQVTFSWIGGTGQLSLNGNVAESLNYSQANPNWTAASNLDIGAYEYGSSGGYNVSDDVVDEFTVVGNAN